MTVFHAKGCAKEMQLGINPRRQRHCQRSQPSLELLQNVIKQVGFNTKQTQQIGTCNYFDLAFDAIF